MEVATAKVVDASGHENSPSGRGRDAVSAAAFQPAAHLKLVADLPQKRVSPVEVLREDGDVATLPEHADDAV